MNILVNIHASGVNSLIPLGGLLIDWLWDEWRLFGDEDNNNSTVHHALSARRMNRQTDRRTSGCHAAYFLSRKAWTLPKIWSTVPCASIWNYKPFVFITPFINSLNGHLFLESKLLMMAFDVNNKKAQLYPYIKWKSDIVIWIEQRRFLIRIPKSSMWVGLNGRTS